MVLHELGMIFLQEKMELPAWAKKKEEYLPSSDRDFFVSRSLLRLFSVLLRMREQKNRDFLPSAGGAAVFVVLLLVLVALSRGAGFLLVVLAGELVLLCFLRGEQIVTALRSSIAAAFVSAVIVFPAVFFGGAGVSTIPCKTFLTVMALTMLTNAVSWHKLTEAFLIFHVPSLFVQVLDLALKYIVLLGELSQDMLYALKLRAVGKNPKKQEAFSAVLGMTFLKSREMSQDMQDAMTCRCYTGELPKKRLHWTWSDAVFAGASLLLSFLWWLLE